LIVGNNGAGKSTILDALCFCLFGKPFRKINKPQLLNAINKKGLLVEVEVRIGNKTYQIRRGIKPNLFEIHSNGVMLNQSAETKDYQEYLEKHILKMNFKSFSQIVILGSASFVPFMQLSAANRREVVEDLLDIQIFSTMNTLLKEKVSQNKTDLQDITYEMRLTGEKIEMQKKLIQSLKENNKDEEQKKIQKGIEISGNLQIALADIKAETEAIEELSKSIADQSQVANECNDLVSLKKEIQQKVKHLTTEINFFNEHDDCPTCKQSINADFKTTTVEGRQKDIDANNNKIKAITDKLEAVDKRMTEINDVLSSIQEKRSIVRDHQTQVKIYESTLTQLRQEIKDIRAKNRDMDADNTEINSLKVKLKEQIEKKEELLSDKSVLDVAAVMLKDSGVKTKIIKQYVPVINKLVNKYLSSMDFFVNFELNENFEETIKSRHRDDFSYESFSEGEKMRIDLALLFTWRAISKMRNSASTNLLIMDEVFDSSLDNNGTEEFLKIISTLTSDTNLFVISHKGDQLFDKFHSVIKFEKVKNFSRISK
jgi:DNA repair exonuclease SbcCD ATPase subunit